MFHIVNQDLVMRFRTPDYMHDPLFPMSSARLHPTPSLAPARVVLEPHCQFVEVANVMKRTSRQHRHVMLLVTYIIDLGHCALVHRMEEIMIRKALGSGTFLH